MAPSSATARERTLGPWRTAPTPLSGQNDAPGASSSPWLAASTLPAALLAFEGFASLGCESLAPWQLIPVSGAGLQTNSVLIGCRLAPLAYRYSRGCTALRGKLAERTRVQLCFAASALIAMAALGIDTFQMAHLGNLPIWAGLLVRLSGRPRCPLSRAPRPQTCLAGGLARTAHAEYHEVEEALPSLRGLSANNPLSSRSGPGG